MNMYIYVDVELTHGRWRTRRWTCLSRPRPAVFAYKDPAETMLRSMQSETRCRQSSPVATRRGKIMDPAERMLSNFGRKRTSFLLQALKVSKTAAPVKIPEQKAMVYIYMILSS